MTSRVQLSAYDPAWVTMFEEEAQRIAIALGDTVTMLHHIGSTAIHGMLAKPIVDILMEVTALATLDHRAEALTALGYEAMGEFGIVGRRYFRKNNHAGVRSHHIHAFAEGSEHVTRHLAFRDYMRAHPDEANAYAAVKRRLVQAHDGDSEAYMDGKDLFVQERERLALTS